MRDLTSLIVNAVAVSAANGLESAHRHAAKFHEAMADAISAQEELAGDPEFTDVPYWQERERQALGKAAQALRDMPVRWAAVLNHTV